MIEVTIRFEHNDSVIEIKEVEHIVAGKPNIEDAVRRLIDQAKNSFIGALNA